MKLQKRNGLWFTNTITTGQFTITGTRRGWKVYRHCDEKDGEFYIFKTFEEVQEFLRKHEVGNTDGSSTDAISEVDDSTDKSKPD